MQSWLVSFRWLCRRWRRREQIAEPVEVRFPLLAVSTEPGFDQADRTGVQRARAHASIFLRRQEATLFENLQVLHDAGQRHSERRCEIAHTGAAARQPLHDCAPVWLGKRVEDSIELLFIIKHMLKYCPAQALSQAVTKLFRGRA